MAKVTVDREPVPPIKKVILELTEDEALAVGATLGSTIKGSQQHRRLVSSVYWALSDRNLTVNHPRFKDYYPPRDQY